MTPDALVRWYCARREDGGARGFDLVKSRGRLFAPVCGAPAKRGRSRDSAVCSSTVRHSKADGSYACGRCGAPWRSWEQHQLRGQVQESRRAGGWENAHALLVDVGVHLAAFLEDSAWSPGSGLYVENACGRSLRELATDHVQTVYATREAVNAAREEWTRRLAVAGIRFDIH